MDFEITTKAEKQINEKMKELMELCQINRLPLFISIAIKNSDEGTAYKTMVFSGKAHDIVLTDDQINKHILIANGFSAVPKREDMNIDFSSLFSED